MKLSGRFKYFFVVAATWENDRIGVFFSDGMKPPTIKIMTWVWPPLSNGDHQDYHIFTRKFRKISSFGTVTGRGPHPNYC